MTFKFAPLESQIEIVKIEQPKGKGKTDKYDFEVEYKCLELDEYQKLMEQVDDPELSITDTDVLQDNIINITGLKEADGSDLEFSGEMIARFCQHQWIKLPLIRKFIKVQTGKEPKNL